jgi:hypothetical protein
MLPLTKRQREILDYLNEFIQQHGYAKPGRDWASFRPFASHGAQAPDEPPGKGVHQARLEPESIG